jgi:hypothetical protein
MSFYTLSQLIFTAPYFSAVDCLLNDTQAIYCSSELTSGRNLFKAMHANGVTSRKELETKLGDNWVKKHVFDVNNKSANDFAKRIRDCQTDKTPVITPAPLSVPGWGQPEYLAFWEELLRTRVKAVCFNTNWEYSNGCTFEFAVASGASVETLDSEEKPLSAAASIALVKRAIDTVKEMNKDFDTMSLERNLDRMRSSALLPPKMPSSRSNSPNAKARKSGTL